MPSPSHFCFACFDFFYHAYGPSATGNKPSAITALAKSSKNKHSAKLSNSTTTSINDAGPASTTDNNDEELWPKALALLEQMDEDGIEPDGFCYSSAINCCGAEGRWEEACALIETMKRGGPKSRPNKVAYTAAISESFVF